MRYRLLALPFLAVLMSGQDKHLAAVPVNGGLEAFMDADEIERGANRYPSLVRLKGSVAIRVPVCLQSGDGKPLCDGFTIIHADEATYHEDTGEIEATGSVRVTPLCRDSDPCHKANAK